jgi:hypothetical protein
MVYYDPVATTLKYATMANGGTNSWSAPADVASGHTQAPHNSLALAGGLTPHLAFYDITDGAFKHARYSGVSWITDTIQSVAAATQTFVSLAVGTDNQPRVAYHNSVSSATVYASFSGTAWSTFTVNSSAYEATVALDLKTDNTPVLGFMTGFSPLGLRGIGYGVQEGSNFPFGILLTATGTAPVTGVSLAVDSSGVGHMGAHLPDTDQTLYVAFSSTVSVSTFTFLPGGGATNAIALDGNERPGLVYPSMAGFFLSRFSGTTWTTTTLAASTTALVGAGPSLLLNRFDNYLVSYLDGITGEAKFTTTAARNLSIAGTVTEGGTGAPLAGVTLTLGPLTTTSDGSGNYVFTGLLEGAYGVSPSLAGYSFLPASLALPMFQAGVTGQDFQGGVVDFSLMNNLIDPTQGQTTTLTYSVLPGHVTLRLFNLRGELLSTLVDEDKGFGTFTATWDGKNNRGTPVASGIYLADLQAAGIKSVKKIAVVK